MANAYTWKISHKFLVSFPKAKAALPANKDLPVHVNLLPRDVWGLIASSLEGPSDACHLAETCRFLYRQTASTILKRKIQKFRFAEWVVAYPSLDINTLLSDDAALLRIRIDEVIDSTRHRVIRKRTLYQLACGAGDNELAILLENVFIYHYGKKAARIEIERQLHDMLETEEDLQENIRIDAMFDELLTAMIAAIEAEPFDGARDAKGRLHLRPETLVAIEIFKEGFAKTQPKVIVRGMHFRYSLMQTAYNRYDALEKQWENDYYKCALYQDVVLATIQAYVPANDAQKFSRGGIVKFINAYLSAKKPGPGPRSFVLCEGNANYYEVVRGDSVDFVMHGSCINIDTGCTRPVRPLPHAKICSFFLSKIFHLYVWHKNYSMTESVRKLQSGCVLC